ncbi:ABC transporter substrate-binding protein, partial [uncultured Succinivibrio sp.]|uniref:ABC transporter substrate-binding protein n=1 Tax=uncultured Succinivibrio sp. TaxID=540749 RepID=UPI0025E87E67
MIKLTNLIKTVSLCSALISGLSFAEGLPQVKTTMFLEQEGFLMWYAKEQGWDNELGIDIKLEISNTNGIDVINKHRDNPDIWNITAASSIPFIIGSNNMDLRIIGIACDEGNQDYPEICGSPETIKGKTFLVKGISSGAYTLAAWLDLFNLNFSHVVIKDITGPEILKEMENKNVTGAGLWSPDTYESEYIGYQNVTTAANIDEYIPIIFLADNKYVKDNEETVGKFLAVYFRAVEKLREDANQMVPAYQ